jgi:hypothetical protein
MSRPSEEEVQIKDFDQTYRSHSLSARVQVITNIGILRGDVIKQLLDCAVAL